MTETFDPNPTYVLAANLTIIVKLITRCHDMGMRAYFNWKRYSQKRAEQEYEKAYFAELRRLSPNHPHLRYGPEREQEQPSLRCVTKEAR